MIIRLLMKQFKIRYKNKNCSFKNIIVKAKDNVSALQVFLNTYKKDFNQEDFKVEIEEIK